MATQSVSSLIESVLTTVGEEWRLRGRTVYSVQSTVYGTIKCTLYTVSSYTVHSKLYSVSLYQGEADYYYFG